MKEMYVESYVPGFPLNGQDFRETLFRKEYDARMGRPADIDKYFFLPAYGDYWEGELNDFGEEACYWSSSASVANPYAANPGQHSNIFFASKTYLGARIWVGWYTRSLGAFVAPFEQ